MRTSREINFIIMPVLLAALLTIVYWPALTGELVNHDDPLYITENPVILQGLSWHSIAWSFTSISAGHWHPLTWLSHLAAIEMFGIKPFGHHLINLLLHWFSTLLLALILQKMTGRKLLAWLVASLFALHPLNVETVAWVAERKGALSAFFCMLALLSYIGYTRSPGMPRYLTTLFFYLLALCSKAMAVTIPVVFLLLDYWPLGRFQNTRSAGAVAERGSLFRLLAEKVPFALLSLFSGAMAIHAMGHGGSIAGYPLWLRIQNVILGYFEYLARLFYPVELSVFYPFVTTPSATGVIVKLSVLIAITGFVILRIRRNPYLFTGWAWYIATMAPLAGFISLGQQTTPDRYAYVPLIGLYVMLVWGGADLMEKLQIPTSIRRIAAFASLAALGCLSWVQTACWRNSETLFSNAIRVNPYSTLAHNNLGSAYFEKGDVTAAFREFREALRLNQGNDDAWNNLGVAYSKVGRNGDAIEAYLLAIVSNPGNELARLNIGMAYLGLGDLPKALEQYNILMKTNPLYAEKINSFLKSTRGIELHR